LYVQWSQCAGGVWCPLDYPDVSHIVAHGVVVVWKPSGSLKTPSTVLFARHGEIRQIIEQARRDPSVQQFGQALLVTWAVMDPHLSAGVEAYLTQRFRPLLDGPSDLSDPVEVNLPIPA
jgi:hypothetical protein